MIQLLHVNGIGHRVTEESGSQCLWVADPDHAPVVAQLVEQLHFDDRSAGRGFEQEAVDLGGFASRGLVTTSRLLGHYPVTLLTIILGILGALLIHYDRQLQWVAWLTFQPIAVQGDRAYLESLVGTLEQREYWRFLTPIFLHFGPMHAIFNCLWVWEFGRRIERWRGSYTLAGVIVATGVISNFGQYAVSGPSFFGGLSGVLYGLMGFIWVTQIRNPATPMRLPAGIIGFLLIWLVVGITGAIDFVISGSVANGAHAVGLVSGMALALLWPGKSNTQR